MKPELKSGKTVQNGTSRTNFGKISNIKAPSDFLLGALTKLR